MPRIVASDWAVFGPTHGIRARARWALCAAFARRTLSHYFENTAEGLLGVDPPGPVLTTTA